MPQLKISYIVSFSSEDKVHIANNLLGDKPSLKWKCKSVGEFTATVIIQLEKASLISGIDIGNEYSAYIEILVSRSGGNADYKTLLPTTSFMSAFESKEGQNKNRVKMFKKQDFCEPERNEKWDRIKIICGQPFNKHVQFGLSFVKFHSSEVDKNNIVTLGKFSLRPESPISLTRGNLFAKKKDPVEHKLSVAAEIREMEYKIFNKQEITPVPKIKPSCIKAPSTSKADIENLDTPKPRHRKELFYTEDDEKPNPKIDAYFEKKNREKKKLQEEKDKERLNAEKKKLQVKNKEKRENNQSESDKTPKREEKKVEPAEKVTEKKRKIKTNDVVSAKKIKQGITKAFHRLLEDVVLVISGIQNPDRATLRGKIMEMGAKYKSDWDSTCTHLVCAYMNTPKFNQVKGKGKIVTQKWIEECYSQRKKFPWRRFALDKQERSKDESEDEISEEIVKIEETPLTPDYDDTMEPASDTEERIELTKLRKEATVREIKEEPNVYTVDTESEEETVERKRQIKNKPFDFFRNKMFFIDHNLEDDVEEMLKNYIFIHEGNLQDDLIENVDYIICGRDEAKNLHDVNSGGICILPDWIVDCHRCRQFIPPDEYFIL